MIHFAMIRTGPESSTDSSHPCAAEPCIIADPPCELRASPVNGTAPLRRAQQGALLSGALLFALLSGEPLRSDGPLDGANPGDLPAVNSALGAAHAAATIRPWVVEELLQQNPRLGSARSERIADAVLRCTASHKELSAPLVLAVMFRESNARPGVTSPKGAVGLMQVMPYVYYKLLDMPGSIGHLESNVEAGCLVLADNIRRLGVRKGISQYFWGSAVVSDTYREGVESILRSLEARPLDANRPG